MDDCTCGVELTRNQWEMILGTLNREIEAYDAEIINVEIINGDATPIYALQNNIMDAYDKIASKLGLPLARD